MMTTEIKLKTLVVIDKPHGITSMTVVRVLRKILKPLNIKTIGHAGTLDPYATGVLVVGISREGTRQLGTLTDNDKEYVCEIDLLKDTFSGDMDGFKQEYQKSLKDLPNEFIVPKIEDIKRIIDQKFVGVIKQIPPTLSAIKMNGRKACDLVRKGIEVTMKERSVKIYEMEVLSYKFPVLELRIKCSKGTYIRSIGKDIGKSLGMWGSLLSLRRTISGNYTLKDALKLDELILDDLINNS